MTIGSLFAGIGGFELAAQWAGFTPVWSNEIDHFCCQVLRKNFKHRIIEDDIRNIGKHNLEPVDILTGGFPCQPYSVAGKRNGKEDPRHLWPEMLRVIGEIQPSFVVGENVRGLVNWSTGLVFESVQTDLEAQGYEITSFILPACGAGAWHQRERIWFISHLNDDGRQFEFSQNEIQPSQRKQFAFNDSFQDSEPSHTNHIGLKRGIKGMQKAQEYRYGSAGSSEGELRRSWERDSLPTPTICGMDDGIPYRMERIKALGNAIVPQIAFEIFKAIKEVELLTP